MNTQERQVIDDLFNKLREAERQSGPREPTAEAHIRSRVEAQPGASYYMAQTIVMQEQALHNAQARIEELERELASRPAGSGGFLSSLFGGGQPQMPPQSPPDNMQGYPPGTMNGPARAGAPWGAGAPGAAMAGAQPGRGGFLAGAAQTAMGVAGGMMLGSMLGSAFGGGQANAAEANKPQPQPAAAEDSGDDSAGDFSQDI
jgi:hypothetical protein